MKIESREHANRRLSDLSTAEDELRKAHMNFMMVQGKFKDAIESFYEDLLGRKECTIPEVLKKLAELP